MYICNISSNNGLESKINAVFYCISYENINVISNSTAARYQVCKYNIFIVAMYNCAFSKLNVIRKFIVLVIEKCYCYHVIKTTCVYLIIFTIIYAKKY